MGCTENHRNQFDRDVVESDARAMFDYFEGESDGGTCCELWLCSKHNRVHELLLKVSSLSVLNFELHLFTFTSLIATSQAGMVHTFFPAIG